MNFLAHCLLGHPDPALMAGGFIGDFIKGPVPARFPPPLSAGIRLHRRIDAVSNTLPGIAQSVARLHPALRRAAPVLVDILADHCLAKDWARRGTGDLAGFAASAYAAIGRHRHYLPANGQRFFDHMRQSDLLTRYQHPDTAKRAMLHILERLRQSHLAAHLDDALDATLPALEEDFAGYFPALVRAVDGWKVETRYVRAP